MHGGGGRSIPSVLPCHLHLEDPVKYREKGRGGKNRNYLEARMLVQLCESKVISPLSLSAALPRSPSALTRYDRWILALLEIVAQ